MRLLRRVLRSLRFYAFARDKRANVAMTFGLLMVPIVASVGAAVDYSRANAMKAHLQAALDATSLMLAKEAATDTATQLQTNATKYFNAQFNRPEATNVSITATYTASGGSQVTVSAAANEPTAFMGIFGYNSIPVSSSSTSKWGNSRLRVALVLDNTGSMSQYGKLTALKSATQNLLSQLQSAAANNGDVYVSIIPFVKDVDIGSQNYTSDYIYWGNSTQDPSQTDNTSWDANNGSCSKNYSSWGYASPRAACLASSKKAVWTPASHSTWNGCVMDRGYPQASSNLNGLSGPDTTNNYDTNVGAVDITKPSSLWAAEQYSSCPTADVMGLSYDWTGMNSLVNNMTANGNTNQAIGLQLGWESLVGGGPFTAPSMDPNYTYSQIIILLTDGLNTQDRWYTSQSSIDTRQATTCSNIKAAGITLYTIQVNTDGDPTSTLLQNCASSSDKFFLLTSASEIVTTFNQIGTNLSRLYVAK
jgi:Flp pilus assembly protein TadG